MSRTLPETLDALADALDAPETLEPEWLPLAHGALDALAEALDADVAVAAEALAALLVQP